MIWRGRDNSGQGEGPPQGYSPPPTTPGEPIQEQDPVEYPAPGGPAPGVGQGQVQGQQAVGSRVESVLDAAERAAFSIREDAQVWARNYLEESKRKADEAASARMREISDLTDSLVSRARAVAQQSDELISAMDDAGRRVVGAATPGRNNDAGGYPDDRLAEAAPAVEPTPPLQPPPPPEPAAQVQMPPVEQAPPPVQAPSPPPPAPAPIPPAAAPPPAAPPAAEARPTQLPPPPPAPEPPPAAAPSPSPPPRPVPERPTALPDTHEAPRPVGASSEGARLLATQMAVAGSSKDEIAWRLREEFGIEDSSAILAEIGI